MLTMWIAFLVWIYINPPGHEIFVFLTSLFVMISAMMRMRPSIMFLPFLYGSAFAGIMYVFVMPHLSGYIELGLMVFGVTQRDRFVLWPIWILRVNPHDFKIKGCYDVDG